MQISAFLCNDSVFLLCLQVRIVPVHFRSLQEFTKIELVCLIERAIELKKKKIKGIIHQPLAGKTIGLFFEEPSPETRISFESAIYGLGGQVIFLSPLDISLTGSDSLKNMSRVMCRYVDGMVVRTFRQDIVDELVVHSSVPVINAQTGIHHPCQILGDMMTVTERKGSIENLHVSWIGDGNNMANSWIQAAARIDFSLTLACPEGYDPDAEILAVSRSEAARKITLVRDPEEAVCSADVIIVNVSPFMDREKVNNERSASFLPYRLNSALLDKAQTDCIVLHCLPAYRDVEITDKVFESNQCAAFDQVENSTHIHRAVLESFII